MIKNIAFFFFLSMVPVSLLGMLLNPGNKVAAIKEIFNSAKYVEFARFCAHYIKTLYDAEHALKYTQSTNKYAILKKQLDLVTREINE